MSHRMKDGGAFVPRASAAAVSWSACDEHTMAPTPAAAAEALKEKLEALKEQLTDERNRPYVIGGAVALVATAGLVYYLRSSSGAAAAAKPAGETGTPKPKKKKSKAQEKRADEDRGWCARRDPEAGK